MARMHDLGKLRPGRAGVPGQPGDALSEQSNWRRTLDVDMLLDREWPQRERSVTSTLLDSEALLFGPYSQPRLVWYQRMQC